MIPINLRSRVYNREAGHSLCVGIAMTDSWSLRGASVKENSPIKKSCSSPSLEKTSNKLAGVGEKRLNSKVPKEECHLRPPLKRRSISASFLGNNEVDLTKSPLKDLSIARDLVAKLSSYPLSLVPLKQTFSFSSELDLLQIQISSPTTSNYHEETYYEIRENGVVLNKEGERCEIHMENNVKSGNFSSVHELVNSSPKLHPDVSNDEIVVKILKDNYMLKGTKYLEHSIKEYRSLEKLFEKEENPPFVKIYNAEDAVCVKYTIVEKVVPFEKAPWDQSTPLNRLDERGKKALDAIKKLLKTKLPLDLKWDNLGARRDGTVVLLDYNNIPFDLEVWDRYSDKLSGGNPYVAEHLGILEKKLKSERQSPVEEIRSWA